MWYWYLLLFFGRTCPVGLEECGMFMGSPLEGRLVVREVVEVKIAGHHARRFRKLAQCRALWQSVVTIRLSTTRTARKHVLT
jgi:hypothetical protein